MPKALYLEAKLKKILLKKYPAVLAKILDDTDGHSIYPAFGCKIVSILIVDSPFETSRRLFEVFLFLG